MTNNLTQKDIDALNRLEKIGSKKIGSVPVGRSLDSNEIAILEELRRQGLKPDLSIINNSLVSGISAGDNIFGEFLELTREYIHDDNVFKLGRLPKDGRKVYPLSLLGTISEKADIVQEAKDLGVKPRYTFASHFFKNYNIGLSSVEHKAGNKGDQVKEIMSSFVNFKSNLMMWGGGGEEGEQEPSEKLKRGILGK